MLLLIFISFLFLSLCFNLKDYPDKIGCWQLKKCIIHHLHIQIVKRNCAQCLLVIYIGG